MNTHTLFQMRARTLNNLLRYLILVLLVVLAYTPPASAQTCTPAPVNLVSWWAADGNALDSRSRNNGSLLSQVPPMPGPTFAAGKVGQAFALDGVDDYVEIGPLSQLNNTTEITVSAWVFRQADKPFGGIMGKFNSGGVSEGNSFLLYLGEAPNEHRGIFIIEMDNSVNNSNLAVSVGTTVIPLNTWTHVTATWRNSDGQTRFYKNGVLEYSFNYNLTIGRTMKTVTAYTARIGGWGSVQVAATHKFPGLIDEATIYDRALSATEIAAIHAAGTAGKCKPTATVAPTGHVGWWTGDGDARDISGNNNNGTLENGAGIVVGRIGQSFNFDGEDDFARIPFSASLGLSNFTVETWVKPTSQVNDPINQENIFSQAAGGPQLVVNGGPTGLIPRIVFKGVDNSFPGVSSTVEIPIGQYSHLAGIFDGTTLKIFVNGILRGQSNPSIAKKVSNCDYFVGGFALVTTGSGCDGGLASQFFNGQIDEASLYNRALTDEEIASIFNAGIAGKLKTATTPTGTNISTNVGSDATINFPNVSAAGTTQQIPLAPAVLPALPAGFTHTGLAYDIATAASVSGNINISFHLPSFATLSQFSFLKVLHQEGGVFVDRTVGVDFASHTLAATVSSLSPFVIASGSTPTAVTLESFTATGDDKGVLLEWQTGLEVDNLGFNIYRDEGSSRVRLNPQLVAGSALMVGPGTRLGAGRSYAWSDIAPAGKDTRYWLEEVDLKGQATWFGPVSSQKAEGKGQRAEFVQQSPTLGGITGGDQAASSPLQATAQTTRTTIANTQAHAALASRYAAKIAVNREGWYRVTQPELAASGFKTKLDPRLLQLFVDGRELPILVQGGEDGSFDPSDSIEFYGIGLESPFTWSRVYWLTEGDQPGMRIGQSRSEAAPSNSSSFTQTVERRDRSIYFSGLRNGEKENFFGAVVVGNPLDQTLSLSHIAAFDSRNAVLEVALQGVTFLPHRVNVAINGVQAGVIDFNNHSQGVVRFNLPHSGLREGQNTVRLAPQGGPGDVSLVDFIRISYQHSYTADNDALKLTAPGYEQITIDGFTSDRVRVIDVTDPNAPQEIIGEIEKRKTRYAVSFATSQAGERSLLAFTAEQPPANLLLDLPSNLRSGGADFIIVTTRELRDSTGPLVALRQKQGLSVALVDVEDIYDEFSFGQRTPLAVRDFLAHAKANWKKKPRFVMFAGDSTYDPKNYLGFGDLDLVPTRLIDTELMETSSDDWLSDFDGDGIADIATGRLPARTIEELSTMVAKIISYDGSSSADEALLVADANDGFDFERASTDLMSLVPTSLRITQVNRGRLDPEMARRSLIEALYRKQFLVNYVGHGSVNQWRGNLLTNDDALELRNDHLPMFVMMTCLNGYFHDPALDSLAESLMKAERGGAVAVWASSGMTMPMDQALMNQELYRQLFNQPRAITLGEAVMRAKTSITDTDIRRTWILLGDPTAKLR